MSGKKYRIVNIINNNVVSAINERHQERILVGKGIGFKVHKGDLVDMSKVNKEYFLKSKTISGKLYALLAQTPEIYMEITDKIVKRASGTLNKELDENIFLNLIDHISFAVSRMEKGLEFKNTLLWEIMHFYPQEYEVARYGLELIKKHTGYELPDDEAGSIAMHIVNAEFDHSDMNDAIRMTELIHNQYPEAYECAEKIGNLVWQNYQVAIPGEELVYLTIYIKRITMAEGVEDE